MDNLIDKIRTDLRGCIDEKAQKNSQNFFREKIKVYGVRVPVVKKIGRNYFKLIEKRSKSEIFELCELLWQSGFLEESFIACNWSFYIRKRYTPGDFEVFERWIDNYITNWATCDTFCNHTIGEFIQMYPEFRDRLKGMARSGNRWMRRASAVSFILPARKGKFLSDIFEIADILLLDEDDLVRKGYGWMLKVASEANQKEVFDYVIKNKEVMPRTSLRYAIEKMPKELRVIAMSR